MSNSSSSNRQKYGESEKPIQATRVLAKALPHDFKVPAYAILAINDKTGTFIATNVYGGNLGTHFKAKPMTHDLPAPNSDKWTEWERRGYKQADLSDFDVLAEASDAVESQT